MTTLDCQGEQGWAGNNRHLQKTIKKVKINKVENLKRRKNQKVDECIGLVEKGTLATTLLLIYIISVTEGLSPKPLRYNLLTVG
jgi:hypothetical protein